MDGGVVLPLFSPGSRSDVRMALAMWISQRIQGHRGSSKACPRNPNMKAGPALLQRTAMRCASLSDKTPCSRAKTTFWAPTGYPPRNPIASKDSVPAGIRHIRDIGRRTATGYPKSEPISIAERTKKGNREGINVFIQISIPAAAPEIPVRVSRISMIIPIADAEIVIDLRKFKTITSKESMRAMETSSPETIYFLKGGADMAPDFSWIRRMADRAELMDEVLPGETVIELIGEGRVLIEGHQGVSAYNVEKVCVRLRQKVAIICGCNLKLTHMNENKLIISGVISTIQLLRGMPE